MIDVTEPRVLSGNLVLCVVRIGQETIVAVLTEDGVQKPVPGVLSNQLLGEGVEHVPYLPVVLSSSHKAYILTVHIEFALNNLNNKAVLFLLIVKEPAKVDRPITLKAIDL